jgi:CheY-like chemotaxis protein
VRLLAASSTVETPVVLIVHPHADTREMCREYLRQSGWSVLEAADGESALQFIAHVDVVVTELRLDGALDGTKLIRRIRQEQVADMPIIVMTAHVFPSDRQDARAAGCDAFLSIPCPPERLALEIRRVLEVRARRKRSPTAAARRDGSGQ